MTYPGLPDLPAIVELQHAAPWVCWKAVNRDGKIAKLPINPRTGLNASVSDPHTWGDFAQADRFARTRKLNGVGIVLRADDELIGIDIDKCIDEQGNFEPWARGILDLGETYAETSPSGRGIRMFARGKMERTIKSDAAHVELYRDARYLTVTGNHVHGTPETIQAAPMTIEALIARVAAFQPAASPEAKAITPVAPRPAGGDFFATVNRRAMESLSLWVPTIFGAAARPSANGGYRVASKDLGRDLEEDLSIAPNGIVDFGTADMGDPQQGKRTPIDLAIEYGRGPDAKAAAFWLCGQLGVSPDAMGWDRSDMLPDDGYDASKLRVGSASETEPDAYEPDDQETIGGAVDYFDAPDSMLMPPGLVGALADWICEWASEPVRIHAVGAALVIVGTLIGRKVMSKSKAVGTALYVGALTPSGVGKQHAIDCIKAAIDAASGGPNVVAPMHMGWHTSLPSLVHALMKRPSRAMIVDEFAEKLVGLRSRNAALSTSAISEALRSLWGATHSSYAPDMSISADARGVGEIKRPSLSMYGAATLKEFARALVSKDISNGLFNRFLILPRHAPVPSQPERDEQLVVPPHLVDKLLAMTECLSPLDMSYAAVPDTFPANPVLVPFSDAATHMHEANRAYGKAMLVASEHDDALALYGRYAEQIKRIAMIVAVGRRPLEVRQAIIDVADMEFAQRLVEYSISQFVLMVRREMVENDAQRNHKLILDIIRKAGTSGLTKSELTRKIKGRLVGKLYTDTLQALVDGAEVIEEPIDRDAGKRGPKGCRYRARGG